MSVAVIFPFRAGCPYREAAFEWVRSQFDAFPWEQVIGECEPGPYNRSAAIIDGVLKTDATTLVISDADVWCDGTERAVQHVEEHGGWVVPHRLIWRLSRESTAEVLAGYSWKNRPLSQDNEQDKRPYVGNECGTLLVIHREVLLSAPPDVRFVGWGQEDLAWAYALRALCGRSRRYPNDLVHLWHPPQERLDRKVGSRTSELLLDRYRKVRTKPHLMRELVAEAQAAAGLPVEVD